MLINTVLGILYLICFTEIGANVSFNIDKCKVTKVDQVATCVYNAGDFLRVDCLHNTDVTEIILTRYKDASATSIYEDYTKIDENSKKITVHQNFTEHQDGELWKCTAQTSHGKKEVTLSFKLRDGLHLAKVTGITNGTVIWIAVGFCSLVSLLAVIAVVVSLKCVKLEKKPVRKSFGGPSQQSNMFRTYSFKTKAEETYSCESLYDIPLDEAHRDAAAPNMYSNL